MAPKNKPKIETVIKGKKFKILEPYDLKEWRYEVKRNVAENVISERELRLRDITWKLEHRDKLKTFLLWLLALQNIVVFLLVVGALVTNKIEGLQLVFSTLVAGTLVETASLVYIIAKWLFTDIHYEKD